MMRVADFLHYAMPRAERVIALVRFISADDVTPMPLRESPYHQHLDDVIHTPPLRRSLPRAMLLFPSPPDYISHVFIAAATCC